MFFLRCAFWLSVVYSSMSWTNGALQAHGAASVAAMSGAVTARLADRAVTGATDFCARHADDCLADAARLTSLFAATDTAPDTIDGDGDRDDAPRPVPDPRRHGHIGPAKLAHAS